MITNFIFNDIVLYAKGWYQRTDIVEDLSYLFSEIYGWHPATEKEVAMLMLRAMDKLNVLLNVPFDEAYNNYHSFFERIEHDMMMYDCNMNMAIIKFVLSRFFELRKNQIILNKPHFDKKSHFRLGQTFGNGYPPSQTYAEMNRIVDQCFGD